MDEPQIASAEPQMLPAPTSPGTSSVLLWIQLGLSVFTMFLILALAPGDPPPSQRYEVDEKGAQLIAAELYKKNEEARLAEEAEATRLTQEAMHTAEEVSARLALLQTQPEPEAISSTLEELRNWEIREEDMEPASAAIAEVAQLLRRTLVKRINELHEEALTKKTTREGKALLSEAGKALVMLEAALEQGQSDDLQKLLRIHGEVEARLESLQSVRYNTWAVTNISLALKYISSNRSWFGNGGNLSAKLVEYLAPVDPHYLEPAASSLYQSALAKAQTEMNPGTYAEFAKALLAAGGDRQNPTVF